MVFVEDKSNDDYMIIIYFFVNINLISQAILMQHTLAMIPIHKVLSAHSLLPL
jgi:hypothetical protein